MLKHKPLKLHQELHDRGERVELPAAVVRELAWWVAAELVRRHPGRLRVVEAYPCNYDCVSIIDINQRPGPEAWLVHLNLGGHIQTLEARQLADSDNRFNWYEVLKAPDRRDYVVKQIEGSVGLRRPGTTPRTSPRSIGPRLIARFAHLAAAGSATWSIRAGFGFDSYWPEPYREDLFAAFPDISVDRLGDGEVPRSSRFWFIIDPSGTPVTAIDTTDGLGWGWNGRIPLLTAYHGEGRNLDRVLANLIPPSAPVNLPEDLVL